MKQPFVLSYIQLETLLLARQRGKQSLTISADLGQSTITPIIGTVLDTATGLGYTAIEAARTAQHVVIIELDPGAQQIASLNP